ncbi:MAG: YraN family protein [Chloroflexi bacterium]|nr:YraN family protein [Chloroflexota bacterium]
MNAPRSTRSFGQQGERLAIRYLEQRGYTIIATNWRCQYGEIDIIAHQGVMLVFVEVRARHTDRTDAAFESVGARKQRRLARAVQSYLASHHLEQAAWRVDVIAIAIPPSGEAIIEHAEDALGW